jgi:hypothetical protein
MGNFLNDDTSCLCKKNEKNDIKNKNEFLTDIHYNSKNKIDESVKNKTTIDEYPLENIENIISPQKLHSKNKNEILFLGELQKILIKENLIFPLFCTLTREKLNCYNSKANFIAMKKPYMIIYLNNVNNVDLIKDKDNNLCLLFNLKEDNEKNEKNIFMTKNKKMMFKWMLLLNYFIQQSKMII